MNDDVELYGLKPNSNKFKTIRQREVIRSINDSVVDDVVDAVDANLNSSQFKLRKLLPIKIDPIVDIEILKGRVERPRLDAIMFHRKHSFFKLFIECIYFAIKPSLIDLN